MREKIDFFPVPNQPSGAIVIATKFDDDVMSRHMTAYVIRKQPQMITRENIADVTRSGSLAGGMFKQFSSFVHEVRLGKSGKCRSARLIKNKMIYLNFFFNF